MNFDDLMQQLQQQRQDIGQSTAQLPQVEDQLRQQIFGGNDPTTQSLVGNENDKINQLYQHDKMLSQIYQPPAQGQPVQPTQGPGVAQSVAGATGLQGVDPSLIQNPFGAIQFGNKQDENTLGELTDITNQIKQRHDALGNALDAAIRNKELDIVGKKNSFDELQAQIDDMLKQQDITSRYANTPRALKESTMNDLTADLQGSGTPNSGMTLEDALATYAGQNGVSAQDVYDKYNQINNPGNKNGYGPAKQTPPQLEAYGIKANPATVKRYNQELDALKGLGQLSAVTADIVNTYKDIPTIERLGLKLPGGQSVGRFVDGRVNKIYSELYGQLSNLRTTAIGGRITQQEIKWLINNRLPVPGDSLEQAVSKAQEIKDELDRKIANPDYTIGGAAGAFNVNTKTGNTNPPKGGTSVGKYRIIQVK